MPHDNEVAIYSPDSSVFFDRAVDEQSPHGGGAEVQMALLACSLARAGIRTALITARRREGVDPIEGLTIVERADWGGRGVIGKLREARWVWQAMAAADAEVYLFRGSSTRLLAGAAFCRLRRRRLVFSAANDLDFDFERPDRGALNLRLYRRALQQADLIVTQSRQQLELARKVGQVPAKLIPSFAEHSDDVRHGTGAAERRGAFLWIGRLVDYKRPLAFVRLASALPRIPFQMVVLPTSETPDELAREVRGAAESLANLELTETLPRPEVQRMIAGATAVVLTSAAEGVPNVFLEAWARGVPVISLESDPDSRIEELGLGIVVGGSEERLREATEALWRDPARRDELGRRGREYVREVHSPEAVARRWADALRTLAGLQR